MYIARFVGPRLIVAASALLLGSSIIVNVGGCASGGQARSQAAVQSMQDLRKEIQDVHDQVDEDLASMNALQGATDLKTAFQKFSDDVDKTQSEGDDVKNSVDNMKANSGDYIAKWQDEMSQVTDPNLKAASDARRQAVQAKFNDVQNKYEDAKTAYSTFYADLTSLRTYLSNDLTSEGVTAAKATIDKTNADGQALHAKGKALTDVLDQITNALPGATPPANQ